MSDLTQSRVRELFEYDAEAGLLIWRVRPVEDFATVGAWNGWNTRYAGKVAGSDNGRGYRQIGLGGKMWREHRLIWVHVNGPIPAGMQIDHINGIRDDNRTENLRLVTHAENARNISMHSDNTSGVIGVSWHKGSRKWQAKIKSDGRHKNLGLFESASEAAKARANAEFELGFHPNHGRKSVAEVRK